MIYEATQKNPMNLPPAIAAALTLAVLFTPSCVLREKVTDSSGHVIYDGPVRGNLHESDAHRSKRLLEREDRLGY